MSALFAEIKKILKDRNICVQNFHSDIVENLRPPASRAVKRDSERISDVIPPQIKILNVVITILMHFCSFVLIRSVESCIKRHIVQ